LLWRSVGQRLLACDRRLFRTLREGSAEAGAGQRTSIGWETRSVWILRMEHLGRPMADIVRSVIESDWMPAIL
jgi:hypothetical protein